MLAKSFLWFFLLLMLAPVAQSQTSRSQGDFREHFALRGRVKLPNESPVARARVELRRITGEMIGLVITNEDGQFHFSPLAAGDYVLSVTCAGFEMTRENVDLHFTELANHTVYLRRSSRFPDDPSTPTVSVRELSLPDKAASAFRKGTEMLYEKQDAAASIKHFQDALHRYANYYEAWFQLGVAYAQMRRLDEAVAAFEKSLQLSSHRYAPPLIGLAAIANLRHEFQLAAGLAQRGLDLDPGLLQGHLELGRAQLGLGNLEFAEKSLNHTRSRNPQWPAVHLLLANLHIRRNDLRAVRADLQEYLRLEPGGSHSARAREILERISASLTPPQPAERPLSGKP